MSFDVLPPVRIRIVRDDVEDETIGELFAGVCMRVHFALRLFESRQRMKQAPTIRPRETTYVIPSRCHVGQNLSRDLED